MSTPPPPVHAFVTKVDGWLVGVLTVGILGGVSGAAGAAILDPAAGALAFAILIGAFGLVALLSLPTCYELHPDALVVRSGILTYRVLYASIRSVTPSQSPVSGPAWSLDRFRIDRAISGPAPPGHHGPIHDTGL